MQPKGRSKGRFANHLDAIDENYGFEGVAAGDYGEDDSVYDDDDSGDWEEAHWTSEGQHWEDESWEAQDWSESQGWEESGWWTEQAPEDIPLPDAPDSELEQLTAAAVDAKRTLQQARDAILKARKDRGLQQHPRLSRPKGGGGKGGKKDSLG